MWEHKAQYSRHLYTTSSKLASTEVERVDVWYSLDVFKETNCEKLDSHFPANTHLHTLLRGGWTDTERGVLLGLPKSAICVQRFDDSLNSAIRITYRISLRSSSLQEPRYPLLKVVLQLII